MTTVCPITDASLVSDARRATARLADSLAFNDTRAGQAALVVSELATNLAKFATEGVLLLDPIADPDGGEPRGLEILALDRGPGIADVAAARRDGMSTAGTLGHGLGAIERISDAFEIFSDATGTVIVSEIWRDAPGASRKAPQVCPTAGLSVPMPGESVCGDAWAWRAHGNRLSIFVADGLGHGLQAYDAAARAVAAFEAAHEDPPERIMRDVHNALRSTRGAAAAVLSLDAGQGIGRYCGIGNISGHILRADGTRQTMVSHNGTAGHTAPRIQEFNYPVPADAIVLLHSDGVATHWDPTRYAALGRRHPALLAGAIYRDFSRRRDDVTVVAAQARCRN